MWTWKRTSNFNRVELNEVTCMKIYLTGNIPQSRPHRFLRIILYTDHVSPYPWLSWQAYIWLHDRPFQGRAVIVNQVVLSIIYTRNHFPRREYSTRQPSEILTMAPAVVKFTPPVLDTRPISGEDLAAWNFSPEQLIGKCFISTEMVRRNVLSHSCTNMTWIPMVDEIIKQRG